jgi:hypothetical protein
MGSSSIFRVGWPTLITGVVLVAGCGGSRTATVTQTVTTSISRPVPAPKPRAGELLSVPAVGRIYGRCNPGDARWTITFVNDSPASDGVDSQIGTARSRENVVNPSQTLAWTLVPGRYISHEPADRRTGFGAAAIKTTQPMSLEIRQGTEPHSYKVTIRLTVAAAIGDTTNCALISSSLAAATYYSGGQPPS